MILDNKVTFKDYSNIQMMFFGVVFSFISDKYIQHTVQPWYTTTFLTKLYFGGK